jgi:hypothetical protein
MKTIALLAALVVGAVASNQAFACDWNKEANATPVVVASQQPSDEPIVRQEPKDISTPAPQRTEAPTMSAVADSSN